MRSHSSEEAQQQRNDGLPPDKHAMAGRRAKKCRWRALLVEDAAQAGQNYTNSHARARCEQATQPASDGK